MHDNAKALYDCCHSGTGLGELRSTLLLKCAESSLIIDLPYNHSDHSLDNLWASPTEIGPPSSPWQDVRGSGSGILGQQEPERSMSLETVLESSRASTMPAPGAKLKRNVKGISLSMREL